VPNTWNFKRKKYCIPINETHLQSLQELEYSYDHQNNWVTNYGHEYLDLESYDREPDVKYRIPATDFGDSIGIENINVEKFLPCIKSLLTKKLISHKCRYYIVSYCKELGLPLKDTILLLKQHLEAKTFNHCVYEERQPIFIYRRGDLCFPSCQKLRQEGLCVDTNCRARA
jgi:DNA primase large subunit